MLPHPEVNSALCTELAFACCVTLSAKEQVFPVEIVTVKAQSLLLLCGLLDY